LFGFITTVTSQSFHSFSGYATLQEGEDITFLVNDTNACFPGIFLHTSFSGIPSKFCQ